LRPNQFGADFLFHHPSASLSAGSDTESAEKKYPKGEASAAPITLSIFVILSGGGLILDAAVEGSAVRLPGRNRDNQETPNAPASRKEVASHTPFRCKETADPSARR
jgi:hypothetical protein